MSASSRCTATAISLPATSLPRPPEWSGWAWVMTTIPICSGNSPRVSSPCSIVPELPRSPASINSASPFSTTTVTLAPIARIWNTPPVIAIGMPNIMSLVCSGCPSPDLPPPVAAPLASHRRPSLGAEDSCNEPITSASKTACWARLDSRQYHLRVVRGPVSLPGSAALQL